MRRSRNKARAILLQYNYIVPPPRHTIRFPPIARYNNHFAGKYTQAARICRTRVRWKYDRRDFTRGCGYCAVYAAVNCEYEAITKSFFSKRVITYPTYLRNMHREFDPDTRARDRHSSNDCIAAGKLSVISIVQLLRFIHRTKRIISIRKDFQSDISSLRTVRSSRRRLCFAFWTFDRNSIFKNPKNELPILGIFFTRLFRAFTITLGSELKKIFHDVIYREKEYKSRGYWKMEKWFFSGQFFEVEKNCRGWKVAKNFIFQQFSERKLKICHYS